MGHGLWCLTHKATLLVVGGGGVDSLLVAIPTGEIPGAITPVKYKRTDTFTHQNRKVNSLAHALSIAASVSVKETRGDAPPVASLMHLGNEMCAESATGT